MGVSVTSSDDQDKSGTYLKQFVSENGEIFGLTPNLGLF